MVSAVCQEILVTPLYTSNSLKSEFVESEILNSFTTPGTKIFCCFKENDTGFKGNDTSF